MAQVKRLSTLVTPRQVDFLRWLPAITAAVYLAAVVVLFRGLIHGLYWSSDAAAPLVLAETLRGSGDVVIPHFGVWTSLWWLLATRDLPGHVQLWEVTGYAFALTGVALLGWATARVAGAWSGITAAAAALMIGPDALRWLLSVNFHVSTPFTAALLGAYLVLMPSRRSLLLAAMAGLLVGANAASDPLLWVAGVAPFAIASIVFASSSRRRDIAVRGGIVVGVAVVTAIATNEVMERLGFKAVLRENHLSPVHDLWANSLHFGRIVALLGGANYTFPPGYPLDPVRPLIALLVLCGIASTVAVGVRFLVQRVDPMLRSYACYWAAAIVLLGATIIATPNAVDLGALSVHYTFTIALAVGAGVALAARSRRSQLVVAVAVSAVGVSNIIGLTQGRAETSAGAIETYQRPLTAMLIRKGVTRGYAGYWDAQSLTWKSGMRVMIAPVTLSGRTGLCRYRWNTIDSWFRETPGPTFLIVDPGTPFVGFPPTFVDQAMEARRFGPLTVYLFKYDLARYFPKAKGPDTPCRT